MGQPSRRIRFRSSPLRTFSRRRLHRTSSPHHHSSFPRTNAYLPKATLILLLDLALVPLNPNGLRMFSYPLETLRSTTMQNYIVKWASPNFHRPEYWPFLLLTLATFATLCWSRTSVRPRDLILLVVALYASLISIRMIPLFVLIATPLIAKRLGNWPRSRPRPRSNFRASLNAAIILAMTSIRDRPRLPGNPSPARGRDLRISRPRCRLSPATPSLWSHLQPLRLGWLSHLEALSHNSGFH